MDAKTLSAVARAIDALDFTAENAEIAEIEAERARLESSISEAEARCTEISHALANWQGPDAQAIADALLAGTDAMQAAKAGSTEESLKADRQALRLAIGDLNRRVQEGRERIEASRATAIQRAAEASTPLVEALLADAREAAGTIVNAFAAMAAINHAARTGQEALSRTRRAVIALQGWDGLLPPADRFDVPREVTDLLAKLEGKGPALPVQALASVVAPY